MRITILNQAYYPDVVATAQHMTDWAEHLAAKGHHVTVIASRSVYGKQGAVLPKRESRHGVSIIRVGANIFGKHGVAARALDFLAFNTLALLKTLTGPRPDVIVCLTTPPFVGVVGYFAKLFRRSQYVQYEMDVYPDIAVSLGALRENSFAHQFFDRLHRRLLRAAARIVVLGRDMHALIASKNIPEEKITLVTPWANPDEIVPVPRDQNPFLKEHDLQNSFVVMYSGNLGLGHDITTICSAMEHFSLQPSDFKLQFVFIGGGKRMAEIRTFCESKNLPAPLILDYQPRELLSATLSAADAHLITQGPNTTGLIVPSKLYGILAAGRPILYIGPAATEVALTIAEHRLGHLIPIGDTPALLAAIQQLQTPDPTFESRARQILRENYSRQVNCEKLTAMVEILAPTK